MAAVLMGMAQSTTRADGLLVIDSRSGLQWLAVVLALATAVVHIYLGATRGITPFLAVGVGFVAGVLVFLTRYWRRSFYLVAALFTVAQVVLWVTGGMRLFEIGVVDKVIQVALVVVVLVLYWNE